LRLSAEVENAVLVAIICDRGDRYLSTGIYDQPSEQLNTLSPTEQP
jgi:cysteine synthase B